MTMDNILNHKIGQLDRLQDEISYHDQDLLQQLIEDRIKMTEKQKMTWIKQTTGTMKVSMKEHNKKQTIEQKDMWQFFQKPNASRKIKSGSYIPVGTIEIRL